LSLINLPLLASLKERSTYRELGCFLGAMDESLDEDSLVNEAAGYMFALF